MTDSFDPDLQFFRFVEDLQRRHPEATPVGSTRSTEAEIVRFKANPTFAFPAGEIASIEPHAATEGMLDVRINLLGLYGPASPLPTVFTERVIDAEANGAVGDFLDLFNHRFAGLLFLIWKHYRHDLRYASGASDALSLAVGSLFGLLPRQDEATDQERVSLLPYTGLLAMGSRSASSVGRVLAHGLGMPCRIEEFVPRRIELPPEALFRLGSPLELGVDTLAGESMEDVTGHCRLWFGPVPFGRYIACLPDGSDHATLQRTIGFVLNEPLARDFGFILAPGEVPPWSLGTGKLGWTTWADPPADRTIETLM